MLEQIKKNFKDSDKKVLLIVGTCLLLIMIIGSTYAYFVINNQNKATSSNIQGDFASQGKVALNTNVSNLYLNLNGVLMNQSKIGTKYYATTNSNGVPIINATEGNGIYTLATASMEMGTTKYNCTYKYKIIASLNTPITDGSDEDIKLKFTGSSITNGSKEYTLKELIAAGTNGIEFTGMFENLTAGNNQTITIESTVENTADKQDDFAGNKYNINISPLPGSEGFSCEINYLPPTVVATLNGDTITAKVTKGDNELDSYCITQENTSDNCTWNKLSGTTITYNPTSTGTYYVHVKDKKDKIGTSQSVLYIYNSSSGIHAIVTFQQEGEEIATVVVNLPTENGREYSVPNETDDNSFVLGTDKVSVIDATYAALQLDELSSFEPEENAVSWHRVPEQYKDETWYVKNYGGIINSMFMCPNERINDPSEMDWVGLAWMYSTDGGITENNYFETNVEVTNGMHIVWNYRYIELDGYELRDYHLARFSGFDW